MKSINDDVSGVQNTFLRVLDDKMSPKRFSVNMLMWFRTQRDFT